MSKIDTSTETVTKLLDGVTPGPWEWIPPYKRYYCSVDVGDSLGGIKPGVCYFGADTAYYPSEGTPPKPDDARFIAAARDLVPALLAERDALTAQLEAAFCEGFAEGCDGTWVEGDYTSAWNKSKSRAALRAISEDNQ